MNTGFRSGKEARNPNRELQLDLCPRQNRFGNGCLPPFFHHLGIRLAVHEHFLDATAPGRGHDDLRGEFAGGIAGAFGNVKAFQSVFDVDGIGRCIPTGPGASAFQQDLVA